MQKNAIPNTIAFAGVLSANALANILPLNGYTTGELSDQYPNLFVPAGLTFSIWGLIYLLLLGFVINGFLKTMDDKNETYNRIGWLFVLNCGLNAAWIFAWHYLYIGLSVLIMLGILGTLLAIYIRLDIGNSVMTSLREKWLVHTPFSVYLGWISVATIASFTTFLVHLGWDGGGLSPVLITQIIIGIAALLGITLVLRRRDIAFALVIVWALFGIWFKRGKLPEAADAAIATTALVCMAVVALSVVWGLVKKRE